MTTLYDRRALFWRIKKEASYPGRQSVKLADNIECRYNWGLDKNILDYVEEHAKNNDHKILLPLQFHVTAINITTCSKIFIWLTDDSYISADIYNAGDDYVYGMNDHDGYTTPEELRTVEARRWLKLDNVSGVKHGFPFDQYSIQAYKGGGVVRETPLSEVVKTSHMNCMFITRNQEDES